MMKLAFCLSINSWEDSYEIPEDIFFQGWLIQVARPGHRPPHLAWVELNDPALIRFFQLQTNYPSPSHHHAPSLSLFGGF